MAFGLKWSGSGMFLATEIRVQLHEWLAIVTGTLTPGALIVFVAILAPELLPVTVIGALVYSMFLIGQRVLNEAAYIRIDHKLNELYHASPLSRGLLRRHRGRDARRVPTPEPVRPRHLGDPPSAVRCRVAGPGDLPPRGVGRVVDDRVRRVDALQGHEDHLAVLRLANESFRHRPA